MAIILNIISLLDYQKMMQDPVNRSSNMFKSSSSSILRLDLILGLEVFHNV